MAFFTIIICFFTHLFVPLQLNMGNFILTSDYKPTGDQPEAIRELTDGIERGDKAQVLLGVTGSGKPLRWQMSSPTVIVLP